MGDGESPAPGDRRSAHRLGPLDGSASSTHHAVVPDSVTGKTRTCDVRGDDGTTTVPGVVLAGDTACWRWDGRVDGVCHRLLILFIGHFSVREHPRSTHHAEVDNQNDH